MPSRPPLAQGQAQINVAAERNDKYVTVTVKYRTLSANKPSLHKVGGPIMRAMIEAAETMDVKILAEQRADQVRELPFQLAGRVVTKWIADDDGKPDFMLESRPMEAGDEPLPTFEDMEKVSGAV